MIFPYIDNNYFLLFPPLPPNCSKPPTIYTILESIVNPDVDLNESAPEVKIKDLAKEGRGTIFNFDYPLTDKISKEDFECMILNHFLMRRIGFDTVTAFRIQLNVKINEIMPLYNKMFDAIENWNIFNDGEITERTGTDNRVIDNKTTGENNTSNSLENNSQTTSEETSDRRNSELPQNQLELLRNGSYVSNYNYDQNNGTSTDKSTSTGSSNSKTNNTSNTKDDNEYREITKRSPADKIAIYKEFQENLKSIYGMIFKDLECLFYQLI